MHHFAHHRERFDGSSADARNEEELRKILRPALGRRRQGCMQAAQDDVAGRDFMVSRQLEMREQLLLHPAFRLRGERGRAACSRKGVDDHVRPALDEPQLLPARSLRASIRQVDDGAAWVALDGGVRLLHEGFESLRQPMVATRGTPARIHALLNHRPFASGRNDEAV